MCSQRYLDPINSNFDALSNQPSWDLQLQETHIFSPTKTNEFTAAGSHYVAQFAQNEAKALATFPQSLQFGGNTLLGPQTGLLPTSSVRSLIFPRAATSLNINSSTISPGRTETTA